MAVPFPQLWALKMPMSYNSSRVHHEVDGQPAPGERAGTILSWCESAISNPHCMESGPRKARSLVLVMVTGIIWLLELTQILMALLF